MKSENKKLLNVNQVAEILGTQISTIYAWVHQKRIPHIKVGSLLRFDMDDLTEWISQHRIKERKYS